MLDNWAAGYENQLTENFWHLTFYRLDDENSHSIQLLHVSISPKDKPNTIKPIHVAPKKVCLSCQQAPALALEAEGEDHATIDWHTVFHSDVLGIKHAHILLNGTVPRAS